MERGGEDVRREREEEREGLRWREEGSIETERKHLRL